MLNTAMVVDIVGIRWLVLLISMVSVNCFLQEDVPMPMASRGCQIHGKVWVLVESGDMSSPEFANP